MRSSCKLHNAHHTCSTFIYLFPRSAWDYYSGRRALLSERLDAFFLKKGRNLKFLARSKKKERTKNGRKPEKIYIYCPVFSLFVHFGIRSPSAAAVLHTATLKKQHGAACMYARGHAEIEPILCGSRSLVCVSPPQVEAKYPDQVKVYYSSTCDSIEQVPGGSGLEVRISHHGKEGGERVFRPQLLVGADGLKSTVSVRFPPYGRGRTEWSRPNIMTISAQLFLSIPLLWIPLLMSLLVPFWIPLL